MGKSRAPARARKAQSFEQFVQGASRKATPQGWDDWPQAVCEEIAKVLELNDSGKAHVSAEAMVRRLVETYELRASIDIVKRYVRTVLGRSSWRHP